MMKRNKLFIYMITLFLMMSFKFDCHAVSGQPDYEYTYEFGTVCDFEYKEYEGMNIYSDNGHKTELFCTVIQNMPEKISAQFKNNIVFFAEKPVNRYIRYEKGDRTFKGFGSHYLFGVLEGLTGYYDDKYGQLCVQSNLSDDEFLVTVTHEMGHYLKVVTKGTISENDIKKIQALTEKLSPLKNADHIKDENEAYAEAFMFYCLYSESLKQSAPDVYNMFENMK